MSSWHAKGCSKGMESFRLAIALGIAACSECFTSATSDTVQNPTASVCRSKCVFGSAIFLTTQLPSHGGQGLRADDYDNEAKELDWSVKSTVCRAMQRGNVGDVRTR